MKNIMKSAFGGKKFLAGLGILSLLALVVAPVLAAPSHRAVTPKLETITFVDYWTHAGPGPHPSGENDCSGNFRFTNGGLKWSDSSVNYALNSTGSGLGASDVSAAITAAFDVWKTAESISPTFNESGGASNTIAWASLGTTGVVAQASITYNPPTKTIVAFSMTFNSDLDWSITGEAEKFDVQNIAVHETGHVEGLNHVNAPKDGVESMYRLTATGETLKGDLCVGDIAGIQKLY